MILLRKNDILIEKVDLFEGRYLEETLLIINAADDWRRHGRNRFGEIQEIGQRMYRSEQQNEKAKQPTSSQSSLKLELKGNKEKALCQKLKSRKLKLHN